MGKARNFKNHMTPEVFLYVMTSTFDTLDHKILIKKVEIYGVSDSPGKLLENYLANGKRYVFFDDINSQVLNIKTGVPQGSILGPPLFLIYVNYIVKSSKKN